MENQLNIELSFKLLQQLLGSTIPLHNFPLSLETEGQKGTALGRAVSALP